MKLVHPDFGFQMQFGQGNVCELVIESPGSFAKYVQELLRQTEGEEGDFVLSEGEKEYPLSKYAEIIVNPLAVDINDKKILNKLYHELAERSVDDEMYLLTQKVTADLQSYFFQLEQRCPYMLESDMEIDMIAVFKALGVKLENYSDDFFENIVQYTKILAELMGKRICIFVNIRSYLDEVQVEQLIEMAEYNEMALLFIEKSQDGFSNGIARYIIDKDNCEIYE